MSRSPPQLHRTGGRVAAAGCLTLIVLLAPSGVGSAATVSDTSSATVTLDSPGTVTLDGFDPDLGTLTAVQVTLRADLLVQVCIENTGPSEASMAAGTATATLDATFPGGANRTVATVDAATGSVQLDPSNGTADCAAGYDDATGRFPDQVTAADTVFFERADLTTRTATLTGSTALAPFIGDGTIAVTFAPASDTELVLPAEWDNLAVAQGQLQALVTYTYTPATDLGPQLPGTGSNSNRIVTIAVITLLVGLTAVLAAKRWRPRRTPPASIG
jgi:LPXTG-motif cell wall-anchored protein